MRSSWIKGKPPVETPAVSSAFSTVPPDELQPWQRGRALLFCVSPTDNFGWDCQAFCWLNLSIRHQLLCVLGGKCLPFCSFNCWGSGKRKVGFCPFEKHQAVEVTALQLLFYVSYIFYFLKKKKKKVIAKCLLNGLGFHQIGMLLWIATWTCI